MIYDIDIDAVRKRFGTIVALDGLTLHVRQGEMFGLIGPDGAGKTTLLRILCGLYSADGGSCRLAGRDPNKDARAVRAFLGYMPQRFSLYPDLTVAENLRFFADLFHVPTAEREAAMKRLLRFSRLEPFLARRADALSGGMKQKLALSCALIHTPKILLLDEPTTGVDPVSRREFWSILGDLRSQGVTILVTTPYMDEAARCDRIAFIHKGQTLVTAEPALIPTLFSKTLLEVHCPHHLPAARALQASGRFMDVKIFGDRLHVSGHHSARQMTQEITSILEKEGITGSTIRSVPPSIEDIFMEWLR